MKLVLDETEYHIEEVLRKAPLGDLLKLKLKTKTPEFLGVTVTSIQSAFKSMGEKFQADDFNGLSLLSDEEFLQNIIGLIWLARRNAGEYLEVDEAGQTAWSSINLTEDDDEPDAEGEADPKAPAVSAPDAADAEE